LGAPVEVDGPGYGYEGKDFSDFWYFEGGLDGELVVNYSDAEGDDSGCGWNNVLRAGTIVEHAAPAHAASRGPR
jgi:hypothetical protein